MPYIVYVGPQEEGVEIAPLGVVAMPGEPVEVSEELAEELLERDDWDASGEKPGDEEGDR